MTARTTTRRRATVVGSALLLMLGGGVAWAAWTTSGTGAATAQATTAGSLTVTAGTPVGSLYPKPSSGYGSSSVGAVHTTVSNPNAYPVQVAQATIGAITIQPLAGRTCAAGSVIASVAGPMTLSTPVTLAAGATGVAVTIPGAIEMVSTAEDGCQGAGFSMAITLTAVSA